MSIGIGNLILNLIYPPRCIFCGKRLSPKSHLEVCDECSNSLPFCKAYQRCSTCGMPVSHNSGGICGRCCTSRRNITRSTSPFIYADNVRSAIIRFKKFSNASYAKPFSYYIKGMIDSDFKNIEFDTVVSVPPRKRSTTQDAFDQAARLAKEVSLRLGVPYLSNAMYQTKHISKQSSLTFNARLKNVQGAFAVKKKSAIKNKTVLLIDDVRTSGATLNECASVLKEAGAFRVYSATIAIAVTDN